MNERVFDDFWRQATAEKFAPAEDKEELCIHAVHFAGWAEQLYQEALQTPTLIGTNQKMLLLTKKYFEWRTAVPKSHRDRIGERSHVCIFHVFERTYHRLKALELSLSPPLLFLPPPPAPRSDRPEVVGVLLGEVLGEE